ncbi:Aminobutyraldehyde dehydrogenase [Candidatus Burkholderia crenata]|nr:Aminobutyraldehyde dehydrogenase [Candidatus Burkholderia crenata]
MLYEYCDAHGVLYNRGGKLIVATARNQLPQLAAIQQKAIENGVTDLVRVSGAEAMEMEPQLQCVEAVLSQTGIIDSHQFMLTLQGDAERDGATVAFHTPVTDIDVRDSSFIVETGGEAPMRFQAGCVINSAGLSANQIARTIRGLDARHVPPLYFAKGNYFTVSGGTPFERLIYPMSNEVGLGVHLTLDMGGQAKFGPDVEWIQKIDYAVDP